MIVTVTHARLRAAQGDLAGARRILLEILRTSPDHTEARELLERCSGRPDRKQETESERPLPPPVAADSGSLSEAFRRRLAMPPPKDRDPRIARLEAWLKKIRTPR